MIRQLKITFLVSSLFFIVGFILYFTSPAVAHKAYDYKADLLGTNRTITFYSPISGTPVQSYTDKDTRFEALPNGAVSVWLGSANKKVYSTLPFIIEDR